jgi:hypothetical protein
VNSDRSVDFSGYSTNKAYHHDITGLLLNVVLNTITLTLQYTRIDIHRVCGFKYHYNDELQYVTLMLVSQINHDVIINSNILKVNSI